VIKVFIFEKNCHPPTQASYNLSFSEEKRCSSFATLINLEEDFLVSKNEE